MPSPVTEQRHTYSPASPSWGRPRRAFCNGERVQIRKGAYVGPCGSDSIWLVRCWLTRPTDLTDWLTGVTYGSVRTLPSDSRLTFDLVTGLGWWLLFCFKTTVMVTFVLLQTTITTTKNWWREKWSTLVYNGPPRDHTLKKNTNGNGNNNRDRRAASLFSGKTRQEGIHY